MLSKPTNYLLKCSDCLIIYIKVMSAITLPASSRSMVEDPWWSQSYDQ